MSSLDWRITPAIRFGVGYQGELAATAQTRQGHLHLGFLTAPPALGAVRQNTMDLQWEIDANYNARH